MVDMTKLLTTDTSEALPPANPPDGRYPGVLSNWKVGKKKIKEDEVGVVTLEVKATGWPADAEPLDGMDITRKKFFRDYLLNPEDKDTYFFIDKVVKSCGVNTKGRQLGETLPEIVGSEIYFTLASRNYEDKNTHEMKTAQDVKVIEGTASRA